MRSANVSVEQADRDELLARLVKTAATFKGPVFYYLHWSDLDYLVTLNIKTYRKPLGRSVEYSTHTNWRQPFLIPTYYVHSEKACESCEEQAANISTRCYTADLGGGRKLFRIPCLSVP